MNPARVSLFALTAALFLAPGAAEAATPVRSGGNLGLGVGGGYWHNGLSIKYFAAPSHSLQGVVGAYGFNGGLGFTGDYLYEMPALMSDGPLEIGWNIGFGPSLGVGNNDLAVAIHGTLGLEFNIQPVPIDIVLEYKPGIFVLPDVGADLWHFAGHIRIYPFNWHPQSYPAPPTEG